MMDKIMTPLRDGAKFVFTESPTGYGHTLFFVDGHGYSRAIATSIVTDRDGNDLAWLADSAASFHQIGFEREARRHDPSA